MSLTAIFRRSAYRRFIRFVAVGGICFTANLAVLFIGTGMLGLHYLISMAISILVVNILGWGLNRNWTFGPSAESRWLELLRYSSATLLSSGVATGLMAVLVSVCKIHYLVASCLIALLMLFANFLMHRDWSFRKGVQTR